MQSLNSENDDGVERVVVYINDQRKDVRVDTNRVEIPRPRFKVGKEELLERLIVPFSILNCSQSYIYTPTDKQKKAITSIQDIILSVFMDKIANNLPADVLKKQRKVSSSHSLSSMISQSASP